MSRKILVFLSFFLFFLLLTFVNVVRAATTATVAATVTVQSISVTVTDGTVSYGTMGNNTSKSTITTDLNDMQTATNNGNVAEDFQIKGQDSADWTLAATAGSNQYVHKFCTATCTTPPTSYTALTLNNQTLASNVVATSGTQTFYLQLTTPNPSTVFTSQSVDVTVTATAH